ncbi:hypothetical protein [Pseudonocardia asaccharolytica]|uniref:Uncharacterized protein n=1 Tax=Pseudonocardia asaccharolytica DSM 44247 = NBRC 16224 TaxID=1123024 RepID=A0A511D8P1_9PSEU|nr:hypothetical protein [Pseudonocardia asaccharolytica]GEL19308.1 hypothetical protein PA7_31450 [Pseudonocardia asaccharolytica DSM 44247 = NBRC 16224]
MTTDPTPTPDLADAEAMVRHWARTWAGPLLAVVLAEYDRRGTEIQELAYQADRLRAERDEMKQLVEILEANLIRQANCGVGHDPEQICCAHAAEVQRLRTQRQAALALHRDAGPSQGYDSSGCYDDLPRCCGTCGAHGECGVPWPCPTAQALGVTDQPDQVAT